LAARLLENLCYPTVEIHLCCEQSYDCNCPNFCYKHAFVKVLFKELYNISCKFDTLFVDTTSWTNRRCHVRHDSFILWRKTEN